MSEQNIDRILIVYDSRTIRETLCLLGETTDLDLIEIDEPEKTLDAVRQQNPSLVVLCAMTVNPRAYDICRQLKQEYPGLSLPVIILTINDSEETRRQADGAGADEALQLSLSAAALLNHIHAFLRARQVSIRYDHNQKKNTRDGTPAPTPRHSDTKLLKATASMAKLMKMTEMLENRLASIDERFTELEKHLDSLSERWENLGRK